MNARRSIFIALCLLSVLSFELLSTIAQARTLPPDCTAATEASAYEAGVEAGRSLVQQAWDAVNDCDGVKDFREFIVEEVGKLTLPASPSSSTKCRYTGTIDGVGNQLNTISAQCNFGCFVKGQAAGESRGQAYCELSIVLGGLSSVDEFLRYPPGVCGSNFRVGCEIQFIATTRKYSNPEGTCEPYTTGSFVEVWDKVRKDGCRQADAEAARAP